MVNTVGCSIGHTEGPSVSFPPDPKMEDTLPTNVSTTVPVETHVVNADTEGSIASPSSDDWLPPNRDVDRKRETVMRMFSTGARPLEILNHVFPSIRVSSNKLRDEDILMLLEELIDKPPKRAKLYEYNTFADAVQLFKNSKRVLILTGAGVSVSCGIPDFRSKDGIYARLHISFPDLPDPAAMFDIHYFRSNPKPFYDFAQEIFPGAFEPSFSHKFIAHLEKKGQLLRNYTQNIDTLEKVAGIERVIECHGSFSSATCLECKRKYSPDDIRQAVLKKEVAMCASPDCKGVIKPDIVFFGEGLHEDFHRQMSIDKDEPDLLVVIGSSLKVRPVSLIPLSIPPSVPQILINRETIPHYTPDIELLGNCDEIIREIALSMGEEDFVINYDKAHGRDPSLSTVRHTLIPRSSFDTMFSEIDAEQLEKMKEEEEKTENATDSNGDKPVEPSALQEEDTPSAKRARLESSDLKSFYSMRYINIESHLPENSFFEVSTNQYVFRGAEMYMDMDTKVLCQPPTRYTGNESDSSDDCDDCEDDYDPPSHSCSEPARASSPECRSERSSSCLPSLDTESLVPARILRCSVLEGDEDVHFIS